MKGGIKKREAIYPRQPIFVNLKSNTMKNTVQRYRVYVIQHNVSSKIFYLLTLINFESSVFLLLPSLISHTSGECLLSFEWKLWFRHLAGLFYVEYQSFQIFSFRMIDIHRMVGRLGELV